MVMQAEAAKMISEPLSKRLNLGCGFDIREGYLNVDLHERHRPDLVADVTSLPMLPSGYFEEIVAQDILEHLERHKTIPTLQEWSRLLAPGAVVHLRVPSLFGLFELLASPGWRSMEKTEEVIHYLYGSQAYTGDYHLAGFTARLLAEYLSRAGLTVCKAELFDSWLFVVSARKIERLDHPLEIAHNVYFRILDRVGDQIELNDMAAAIAAGRLDQAGAEMLLMASEEAKFLATHPVYLRNYRNRLDIRLWGKALGKRVGRVLRKLRAK